MPDAVGSAVLDRLPDRFLPITLPRVNRDVEIFALDVVKGVHMFLRRVTAFFSSQVEAQHSTFPKIDREFRHLQRCIHIAHGANDQTAMHAKIFSAPIQSLQRGRDYLLMGQSSTRVENRREPGLKVNYAISAKILGLLVRNPL